MAGLTGLQLKELGAGTSIAAVCGAAGISRDEFNRLWQQTIEARVPTATGAISAAVRGAVSIERDACGIPHIFAGNDADLFFGFGYAMAQDRLFQLDYLRRKGQGRLAEILGKDGLAFDLTARTVGLNRIAAAEWSRLPSGVQDVLEWFSAGVNAVIVGCGDKLPVEFEMLDYRPEAWTPLDSLAIEVEFRWYLTGRFPVIYMPELAKRALGEGPLLDEFLLGEADEESILHRGEYSTRRADCPPEPVGHQAGDPDEGIGSNNWVIGGRRTTTGLPLVASDPHIALEAVSCWYEAHLCGGSYNVAGMAYAGMPAIMFGRTEHVGWAITNNICSLRDLYQERISAEHPGCFLFDGRWEHSTEVRETIAVRGGEPVERTVRSSRNGPIVDELLPKQATERGPVALKWLGHFQGGWLTALLQMDQAASASEFREALRPWHVPTFSLVFADTSGNIGYHAAGRIPLRKPGERGFRPGWDPEHQWTGLIPFEGMPQLTNPERGWIATANNRVAADDFPYPLSGCWSSAWRGMRIRQMIESSGPISVATMQAMQLDAKSLRAATFVPRLVETLLQADADPQRNQVTDPLANMNGAEEVRRFLKSQWKSAVEILQTWDFRMELDSVGASLFDLFFAHWTQNVAKVRFEPQIAELVVPGLAGCAGRLLMGDPAGWFADETSREDQLVAAFEAALGELRTRLGPDMAGWTWGRLHRMPLKHVLSARGDLGALLDHCGAGVRGDTWTVCNTGIGPDWTAASGAGYRLVTDLSTSPPSLFAVDAQSQSGHPGSPHYADQFTTWQAGEYHEIPLDRNRVELVVKSRLSLTPANS